MTSSRPTTRCAHGLPELSRESDGSEPALAQLAAAAMAGLCA